MVVAAAPAAPAACHTAQSGARCACVPCASVHKSGGREPRRVRVASRRVGLVGVLWHDLHQSPSPRPEQREQLQWPSRLHLCGGGAINCGGHGPLATGRYQSRLELQLTMLWRWSLHA